MCKNNHKRPENYIPISIQHQNRSLRVWFSSSFSKCSKMQKKTNKQKTNQNRSFGFVILPLRIKYTCAVLQRTVAEHF